MVEHFNSLILEYSNNSHLLRLNMKFGLYLIDICLEVMESALTSFYLDTYDLLDMCSSTLILQMSIVQLSMQFELLDCLYHMNNLQDTFYIRSLQLQSNSYICMELNSQQSIHNLALMEYKQLTLVLTILNSQLSLCRLLNQSLDTSS